MTGRFRAVVFDFDGTILDTESPIYEAWRQVFVDYGVEPISVSEWSHNIGLADEDEVLDPPGLLTKRVGRSVEAEAINAAREVRRGLMAVLEPRPGVIDWLDHCDRHRTPVAVASSSPRSWVSRHLTEHGLIDRFSILSCVDNGVPGKPDPAVYLNACRHLGVEPAEALAIEDSVNGLTAAKAAGMTCLAVPGPMTAGLDFSQADLLAASLDQVPPVDFV